MYKNFLLIVSFICVFSFLNPIALGVDTYTFGSPPEGVLSNCGEMYIEANTAAFDIIDTNWHAVYLAGEWAEGNSVGVTFVDGATSTITAFADAGGGKVTVTSTGHGLINGDIVSIVGTTNYNGLLEVSNKTDNTFEITDTWVSNDATGTWIKGGGLRIDVAGSYYISYHISAAPSVKNDVFDFALHNGVSAGVAQIVPGTTQRAEYKDVGKMLPISGSALHTFSAGDVLTPAIKNTTAANDVTIRNITIVVIQC